MPSSLAFNPWVGLFGLTLALAYPAYLLVMAGVLRLCGVPRAETAKWILKQAGRQRFTDLIRAARGLPPEDSPPSEPDAPSSLSRTPENPASPE